MEKTNNLLKHGYRLGIASSFLSLFSSLFMLVPLYWVAALVFSLVGNNRGQDTPILLASLLIVFTLAKLGFSITSLVLSFKTRKAYKIYSSDFSHLRLLLALITVLATLMAVIISSLLCGLEIKYLIYVDIITLAMLVCTITLLSIYYYRRRKTIIEQKAEPKETTDEA